MGWMNKLKRNPDKTEFLRVRSSLLVGSGFCIGALAGVARAPKSSVRALGVF